MIRIGVCDDVSCYVETLGNFVMDWAKMRKINVKLEKFRSGEEVLLNLEAKGDFAVVFMDIELDGINGMETALKLRKADRFVSIVFVSGHEHYFKRCFRYILFNLWKNLLQNRKFMKYWTRLPGSRAYTMKVFIFNINGLPFTLT